MSGEHEWCRDVRRDEAIRAAEDAAAVPSIQHRDLPEVVAALTERVAELTTKHNALADLARLDAGWLKANEQRLTAERDAAIRERDEARAECKMLLAERDEATGRCKMMLDRVAELEGAAAPAANAGGEQQEPVAWAELLGRLAEWDHMTTAADGPYWIGEIKKVLSGAAAPLEAAVTPKSVSLSNAEGLRTERVTLEVTQRTESYAPLSEFDWTAMLRSACRGRLFDGESVRVVEETKRGRLPDMVARLTAERDAAIRERDAALYRLDGAMRGCVRLNNDRPAVRASVAEVKAERDAAKEECERLRAHVAELELAYSAECDARAQAQRELNDAMNAFGEEPVAWGVYGRGVIRDASHIRAEAVEMQDRHACDTTIVPLYAAPPPRGWLTAEERSLIESLRATFEQNADSLRSHGLGGHVDNWERRVRLLDALLARSSPPRVRRPNPNVVITTVDARERIDRQWIAAIREAGVEVGDE